MKKVMKYILPIYITMVILFTLVFSNIPGGMAGAGHILIYGGAVLVILVMYSLIKTHIFVKNNFVDTENINCTKRIVVNIMSAYFINLLVSSLISGIFQSNDISSVQLFLPYIVNLLVPPIIFLTLCFQLNKNYIIDKKTVKTSIVFIIIFDLIIRPFINAVFLILKEYIEIRDLFNYTFSSAINIPSIFILIVSIIPSMLAGLSLIDNDKSLDNIKRNNNKGILILIITIILYVFMIFRNEITGVVTEVGNTTLASRNVKDTSSSYLYHIKPYVIGDSLFYSAYDSKDGLDAEFGFPSSSFKKDLYYVDKDTLKVTTFVSDVKEIYTFDEDKENIYYTIDDNGPLYKMDKNGNSTKIISSRNPSITFYYDGHIYYTDHLAYNKPKYKKVNINDLSISSVDNFEPYSYISHYENYIYYRNRNGTKLCYDVSKNQTIELEANITSNHYIHNQYIFKIDSSFLYLFNMKNQQYKEIEISYGNDQKIIGIYGNDLYFSVGTLSIYKINLDSLNVEQVVKNYMKFSDKRNEYGRKTVEGVKIVDNFLYYSDYNENDNLYRLNLINNTTEKLTNDKNCTFINKIGDYIYYITDEVASGKNGFYRIKDMSKEVIVE